METGNLSTRFATALIPSNKHLGNDLTLYQSVDLVFSNFRKDLLEVSFL